MCQEEKQLPLQKPFKPDGVNRGGGWGTQGVFLPARISALVQKLQFHLWGFTHSHAFGPRGALETGKV